ncbi:ATP-binding protein [Amycolatopsis suaedae]|uniref:histidine kinase n=1 Tax=Amycolatopsis suaedae TaxID=2510978 RepID=A0A4Q7J0S0_9PSEU|nr:ATP-binding protein [Amycolatopsis suaedae]RZQ60409.1 hypothetical protein EWH70_29355 [Amycolatopsis suaedae]
MWHTVVVVLGSLLAPWAVTGGQRAAAAIAAAAVLALTVLALLLPRTVAVLVDTAVATGVCLTAGLTTTVELSVDGASWVVVVASVTAMTTQLRTGPALGWAAAVLVSLSFVAGGLLAEPDRAGALVPFAAWFLAQAGLCRASYALLRRTARIADDAGERLREQRASEAVALARRADEREHLAALHDTAAATLLVAGTGTAGTRPSLAAQAARDLRTLTGSAAEDTEDTDLAALLTEQARLAPLRAEVTAGAVRVSARRAEAVRGAVAEALTNVARHAGSGTAALSVRSEPGGGVVVEVRDDGRGFDPDAVPPLRRGLRDSIRARLATVGGHATVRSEPGRGTTVTLELPGADQAAVAAAEPVDDPAPRLVTAWRRAAFGLAAFATAAFYLPTLIGHADEYVSLTWQLVAFGLIAAVVVAAGVTGLSGRGRRLPVLSLGLLLVASVLSTAAVPAGLLVTQTHWVYPLAGLAAVLVLMDRPVRELAAFLAVHLGVTATQVVLAGQGDRPTLVALASMTVIAGSVQLAVGAAAAALRGVAGRAARATAERERLRTRSVVAAQLRADRRARYAELDRTVVPLLRGLADGTLDPAAPRVRRDCATQAARLRRLLAERDDVADPLVHELRACAEVAERAGVAVTFAVSGQSLPLSTAQRRALTDPVIALLAEAVGSARITVTAHGDAVTVSVLADAPAPGPVPASGPAEISVVGRDGSVWLEATVRTGRRTA